MKLGADPSTTHAVLVGVETYSGGDGWALQGPGLNAMRMTAWLLDQKVPAAHIRLYVNFCEARIEETSAEREALLNRIGQEGIKVQAPTRSLLEAALSPVELAPQTDNSTLLVYFTGHGLSSELRRKRYALTEDATTDEHHAIDIEFLSSNLRFNPSARRFSTQWIIQDACAQSTNDEMRPIAVRSELPEMPQGVRQYCLFATRPGEFAVTEGSRAGEFTWQLLEVLENAGLLQDLDVERIYGELECRFKKLDQHPTLYRRDEHLAEASLSPGATKLNSEATAELTELLRGLSISVPMMRAVFQDVAGSSATPPVAIEDMLRYLDALLSDRVTGLGAVEMFSLRLESYCTRYAAPGASVLDEGDRRECEKAVKQLKKWIDRWPKKRAGAAVGQERRRLASAASVAEKSPVIVLEFQGGSGAEARAWRYGDGAPVDGCILQVGAGSLGEQIGQLLGQLGEKQWLLGETIIELVLPLEFVLQHFSGIEVVADAKYGVKYSLGGRQLLLLVRISERWSEHAWHVRWKDYWNQTAEWRRGKPSMAWLNDGAEASRDGWYWLGARDIESGQLTDRLRKALYEGLPFAAWCAEAHVTHVETVLTGHAYADLIQMLLDVGKLNREGRQLTCLIDDPGRLPPGASAFNSPLQQPIKRANR